MTMATVAPTGKGGAWLLEGGGPADVFTPERMSDEHRLIADTAAEFSRQEVVPAIDRLEQKDWALARALLKRCGDLGLLGVNVPEEYGGVELDKVSSLVVSERMADSPSFGAAYGAQANLCIVPILMFGTQAQKDRYLPGLVTGDIVGAYALSEAGAGSDALSARAHATRRDDGGFVLSGEKMWITNGGFADVMIVFARVDGDLFTAFIVERAFGGVTSGKEEHKMGLHGSSTTSLLLQDVPVPAANLLGEVGKGHKVAFNVLNFGRFKLGAMCVGGCKAAIEESTRYAASRRQFGQAIASFGAIKHKIGEMTARTYALESLMYRIAGLIDDTMHAAAGEKSQALLGALEEFAVEASIAKVFGSEVLDFVLDENVQIHGGNGYVHDYPAERRYRDARVNRIFEGTNEINRLLIPGMLLKRAIKGDLPLVAAARALRDEILGPAPLGLDTADASPLAPESKAVDGFRKTCLLVAGAAMERYGAALQDEQEVMLWLGDLLIETFAADSAVLRARSAASAGWRTAPLQADAARLFVATAALRIDTAAREALAAMTEGDVLRTQVAALRRLLKAPAVNTVALRRRLAENTTAGGTYLFL
jgi:alkylation response protein AidB-like acyl-CoA dehydrogenase